jgi:hypothetical protein
MADFEKTKTDFIGVVNQLLQTRSAASDRNLLKDWTSILAVTSICELDFSFDPRSIHNYYSEDELVFSDEFYFYGAEYLEECCRPGDDCLAGNSCIPIGGVNGADEFIYICNDLDKGIAHYTVTMCFQPRIWMN